MAYHSEEIWESFTALWRQVEALNGRVKEMEDLLGVNQDRSVKQGADAGEPRGRELRESNKRDFVYEGDQR